MMEFYKRSLKWSSADELDEARAKFWTKINAIINKSKSCESDTNRDAKEIRRGR